MKNRLLLSFFTASIAGSIFSMQETVKEEPQASTTLVQEAAQKTDKKNWAWFITYLNFTPTTKGINVLYSSFDPAIRLYDTEDRLMACLQRITYKGTNVSLPDNVSLETYNTPESTSILLLKDAAKTVFSLELGEKEGLLFGYDAEEKQDLQMRVPAGITCKLTPGGLICLSPACVGNNGENYNDFFKRLRENNPKLQHHLFELPKENQ